jgi:hypothetical protein
MSLPEGYVPPAAVGIHARSDAFRALPTPLFDVK